MSDYLAGFSTMQAPELGGLAVLLLYAIQSELRFGRRARSGRSAEWDRRSTRLVSLASAVPALGFIVAVKADSPALAPLVPDWFRAALLPGLPWTAWLGVALGFCGLALRLWAVLTLRDRYTRTLLVHDQHAFERGGPYRWVRHPGYLGSLLCLNGVPLSTGNWIVLAASLLATGAAYRHRVRAEDTMLVASFGAPYEEYRRQVGALVPFRRR
jgi:protein-S-isoprenylcysteine O-methyltransferase